MHNLQIPDPQRVAWNTAYADCIINASQQRVWDVLTDFTGYDSWNSFTYAVEMPAFEVGHDFEFTVNMSQRFQRRQRERITHIEPPQLLAWKFPYDRNPLLNATRYQVITSRDDGTTYYQTWETFTGLFVPLLKVTLLNMIQRGFNASASDLKAHCEAQS